MGRKTAVQFKTVLARHIRSPGVNVTQWKGPASLSNGSLFVPLPCFHWLGLAHGKSDFHVNMAMDPVGQHLGPSVSLAL